MGSINKVILVGRLGADPDLKYVGGNSRPVCNFSLATSEKWKDKRSGETQERTEWHRIQAWGKMAENCSKYLSKGREAYVEGRLQTRSYDKDGQKHYSTDIVADRVVFLGGGQGGTRDDEHHQQDRGRPSRGRSGPSSSPAPDADPPPSDDDIPF